MTNEALKMLVIDDTLDNITVMKAVLEDAFPGITILAALTGGDGIIIARIEKPDVVLLDIVMPNIDGFETCRKLKEDEQLKDIPVLFVTAMSTDRESRIRALESGGEAFITKPIDAIELETQVRAMVKIGTANKRKHSEKELLVAQIGEQTKELTDELVERQRIENELRDANRKQMHLNAAMLNMLEDLKVEIANREKAEEKLKASLDEKEVLIRELYHRTKNNMNLISSYLQLQMMYNPNETTDVVFRDIISRIQSMSLVHQKLYGSQNLSRVNFTDYIRELVGLLFNLTNVNYSKISVSYELEDVELLIDTAIPCGLVTTELVSNCFKHAFPQGREGLINIVLKKDSEKKCIILNISDDGVGLPDGFDLKKSPTLGMVTMIGIIEKQLKGSIEFVNDKGLKCMISFKDNLYTERV